ncbi:hypothetical protein ACOME3_008618 [Neoechinorhynchus agilis]
MDVDGGGISIQDGVGDKRGGGTDDEASISRSTAVLSSYLTRTLPGLLGAYNCDQLELDVVEKVIARSLESINRFVSDVQCSSLVCERFCAGTKDEGDADDSSSTSFTYGYNISNEIRYVDPKTFIVVFLKRGNQVIDVDKQSLASQIIICSMPENGNPYQSVQCLSSNLCLPYFKSYVSSSASKVDSGTSGITNDMSSYGFVGEKMTKNVEKRFADLDTLLVHLQQNIDIPQIQLPISSHVSAVVKKCAQEEEGGRRPTVDDFADKLEDSTFLNQLQAGVNRWIRDIRQVTRLDRDAASGTALQEVNFWLNLESELNKIQEIRDSLEVQLTLDILKTGKRFHAVVSFDSDTGLKEAIEKVRDYNVLMKDFPINDLLSATDIESICTAVKVVFSGLRKIRNTKYPVHRVMRFIGAISKDLCNQMLKVLADKKLVQMDYNDFEKLTNQYLNVFNVWDDEYSKFQGVSRDVLRKKRAAPLGSGATSASNSDLGHHQRLTWRFALAHHVLQERLTQLQKFRYQHEQLLSVIMRVLATPSNMEPKDSSVDHQNEYSSSEEVTSDPVAEVKSAYDAVTSVDVLDLSKESNAVWDNAMKSYEYKIDRVERTIASRLRNQLAKARSANEMFRIFSRFNALFVRSHIRGAISEYQSRLIEHVKVDIENLQKMFADTYGNTGACRILRSRDFPPVSGYLIWVKQIERQLDLYLKRVEDVIGRGWEAHIEGAKLKEEGDAFRERLSVQPIFDDWKQRVMQKTVSVTGPVLVVESSRKLNFENFRLRANFTLEAINLYKECRQFRVLGFRIPVIISNKAQDINNLYPYAIALNDGVQSLNWCNDQLIEAGMVAVSGRSFVSPPGGGDDDDSLGESDIVISDSEFEMMDLLAQSRNDIHQMVQEGIAVTWESYKLESYAYTFADAVFQHQIKVEELVRMKKKIDARLVDLDSCRFSFDVISRILSEIQDQVENIARKAFSNIDCFVHFLDIQIESVMLQKLTKAIDLWANSLAHLNSSSAISAYHSNEDKKRFVRIDKSAHELWISNQVLMVKPPIEKARNNLLDQLFQYQSIVLLQKRIRSPTSRIGTEASSLKLSTYKNLFSKVSECRDGLGALRRSYVEINNLVNSAAKYVDNWLHFQSLWDLQPDVLYDELGSDVEKWMRCIKQIRDARKTFDTQETCMMIGPIKIQYGRVQSKVSLKYDSWHRDVVNRFGQMLGIEIRCFYDEIMKSRLHLEQTGKSDSNRTMDAINLVTDVQNFKKLSPAWRNKLQYYSDGQKMLQRQRYQFPANWIEIENLNGQWTSFNDILDRKDVAIQSQLNMWRMKASSEYDSILERYKNFVTDWNTNKPTGGELLPSNALKSLKAYEAQMSKLKGEKEVLLKAKITLEIDDREGEYVMDINFKSACEELTNLKKVWMDLSKFWSSIEQLRETPWLAVQTKRIRQQISEIYSEFLNISSSRYAPSEHFRSVLDKYIASNSIISDLRSETLKDRHWASLTQLLGRRWPPLKDLTLGDVWDSDLQANERQIRDIVAVAQGENALEEFLKQLSDLWKTYKLDVTLYGRSNKVYIIRHWDDLLEKIRENLNSINSMKMSPYYKQFIEESNIWEDRLNRMNMLFETWIEVQRRYLYLDGLFGQGADVKQLLPLESHKFASVSSDFVGLMQRVAQTPNVLDVLAFHSIQKWLSRLLDVVIKIQKALGDYLEKERSAFPRFYFVGDEDLLEMIGNAKDAIKVQKHAKKMFAGVSGFLTDETGDEHIITGIVSKEGEEVPLSTPVKVNEFANINGWLSALEKAIRTSLERLLNECFEHLLSLDFDNNFIEWIDRFPAQLVVLAVQCEWTKSTEQVMNAGGDLETVYGKIQDHLDHLASEVLKQHPPIRRKKLEHLIIEYVHERDIIRDLLQSKEDEFVWQSQMRFYYDPKSKFLKIFMADAEFIYGYEYLGVQEKLVQTPLTDRCYLSMTQALKNRLGGSPFGPAGTGKTETIKSLGSQLGRFVLVFNCDESFDFQAMGRILIGLCQVGAWGCFDEFNRLEERMLSAISQQIQSIQEAQRNKSDDRVAIAELLDRNVHLNPNVAVFITMNPGYAGRSNLPDNLKKLFRSLAMTRPDMVLIAEIMLYSQGFTKAEILARKASMFFRLCNEQLSSQKHYDFGLRSLKSVLLMAGNLKRGGEDATEHHILIRSIMQSFSPRLVSHDLVLLKDLINDVFPDVEIVESTDQDLLCKIMEICTRRNLVAWSKPQIELNLWARKVLQLSEILRIHHGVMMVGPSGSGKSQAWRTLLDAINLSMDGTVGIEQARAYVIDPKSLTKDDLFGVMDQNTREWTDGLFTHLLRKIINSNRPCEQNWIVFDGDVDPEWVENLNSVLDDNKILTLPNGERLLLPPNVRIMFEVSDLKSATLATVSRCGMIYFSEHTVCPHMILSRFLNSLDGHLTKALANYFSPGNIVEKCLNQALLNLPHIMEFTQQRALDTLISMMQAQCAKLIESYNRSHIDFPMTDEQIEQVAYASLQYCLIWAFAGDCRQKYREEFALFVRNHMNSETNVIDSEISISNQGFPEWKPWELRVPTIQVDADHIGEVVVPTIDTVRHESLVKDALTSHRCLILCGPPGCGKTMTLLSLLRHDLPDYELVTLNFSSGSNIDLLTRSLDQHLEMRRSPNGIILSPPITCASSSAASSTGSTEAGTGGAVSVSTGHGSRGIHRTPHGENGASRTDSDPSNKWIVFFCDEINLPDPDKYGTQRILSFMRHTFEFGGFYRNQEFVQLERVMFVGACNPPTDPGRKPLPARFLRHVNLVYVDYSSGQSLRQIYGIFNEAILRAYPLLHKFIEPLTEAMIDTYMETQEYFTVDKQAHYVYSPRELTRWVRGLHEAIRHDPNDVDLSLTPIGLVRLWAHEALRLFRDRLVFQHERDWMDQLINEIAKKYFGQGVDVDAALKRPILYSDWMSRRYCPVNQDELRAYVQARLKTYQEEQLSIDVVLFDEMLDYCLRIDRVFKQPSGHILLIGVPGSGRTIIARFVAWLNGLSVFQLKVHSNYTMCNFDDDLKNVLRRCACKQERVVFALDYESFALGTGFLERMNTLLANGEVPGLFEGDEYTQLINECKNVAQRQGSMIDSTDDVYKWFSSQVVRNLHVVLTMTGNSSGLDMKTMSTSPALFNRCVLNWFGDWSQGTLYQVAHELTSKLDIGDRYGDDRIPQEQYDGKGFRDAVLESCVSVHKDMTAMNADVIVSPRQFLDFITHFISLFNEKRTSSEEEQLHLKTGLSKITNTFEQVEVLQQSLREKRKDLESKNEAASTKLAQMVSNQQEAENRRVTSVELRSQLTEKLKIIDEKTREVRGDLERVEPAVNEAKQAVQSIKRQHLIELRSLREPPSPVKLTLESVCLLLGQETNDWKTLRTFVMGDGFIGTIINFKTEAVSTSTLEKIKTRYANNPDFTFEKVNKGSQACGPLFKWATAQLEYSVMLNKVGPLRRELKQLEDDASANEKRVIELEDEIKKLEENIERYKQEYAELIREAQSIKSDLQQVEAKVNRSVALLHSLSREKGRWQNEIRSYQDQVNTLVGNVFMCAAFLAYAGNFDQLTRQEIWNRWTYVLNLAHVPIREDLSRIEFLSTADDRLSWLSSIDDDDVCVENAIMLNRRAANRYPLIIDPSGSESIVRLLAGEQQASKVIVTSFLDQSFKKQLESSLRFGNTILVKDSEHFDPIIIPVLNHELRQMSGRVLVSLVDQQDIDFSPSFKLFMCTRESNAGFSGSLCSRVSIVNFTVTPASLQAQCLKQVLRSERPDVEKRRSDVAKLQGEFQQRLRRLEKDLLAALNEQADGRGILEDDSILTRLEALKKEANEISVKAEETESVISVLEETSRQYALFISACSSIFFALQSLEQIHYLYSYSLEFFMSIFNEAIRLPTMQQEQPQTRIERLKRNLFKTAYKRVKEGLLEEHRVLLGLSMLKLYKESCDPRNEVIFDHIFKNVTRTLVTTFSYAKERLSHLSENCELLREPVVDLSEKWFISSSPEMEPLMEDQLLNLLILQTVRPDRFMRAAELCVESEFASQISFSAIVNEEITCYQPVILCSPIGHDASVVVEQSVDSSDKLRSIALGSSEGCEHADQAIKSATQSGKWVLLKNAHLASSWLTQLDKRLSTIQNEKFRLFISMEITERCPIPSNLLRMSRVLVFEPTAGLIGNIRRITESIPQQRMDRTPKERAALYLALIWLHSVILERIRYVPYGWTKLYDFSEADLHCGLDVIDVWIERVSGQQTNIELDSIPWTALRTLLKNCVYGGRIDNDYDKLILDSLIDRLFSPQLFHPNCTLAPNVPSSGNIPRICEKRSITEWIEHLPSHELSPIWLGLGANANQLVMLDSAFHTCSKLKIISGSNQITSTRLLKTKDGSEDQKTAGGEMSLLEQIVSLARSWLQRLPDHCSSKRTSQLSSKSRRQLDDLLDREIEEGSRLLTQVRNDLESVITASQLGPKLVLTNELRQLTSDLSKGVVPRSWVLYDVPNGTTFERFLSDLDNRIRHFNSLHHDTPLILGYLFSPQAYLTLTRRVTSQQLQCPIDQLILSTSFEDDGYWIDGLTLDGAGVAVEESQETSSSLKIRTFDDSERTDEDHKPECALKLPRLALRWTTRCERNEQSVRLPIYLNRSRSTAPLASLDFHMAEGTHDYDYWQRGCAILLSTL